MNMTATVVIKCIFLLIFGTGCLCSTKAKRPGQPAYYLKFLVSIFHRFDAFNGCKSTNKTILIKPGEESIQVRNGGCDTGHLHYAMQPLANGKQNVTIFYNSSIETVDEIVTCSIFWDGKYLVPTKAGVGEAMTQTCTFTKPQGSYGFTIYWFHILDWMFGYENGLD